MILRAARIRKVKDKGRMKKIEVKETSPMRSSRHGQQRNLAQGFLSKLVASLAKAAISSTTKDLKAQEQQQLSLVALPYLLQHPAW